MSKTMIAISPAQSRRLAVTRQRLSGGRPTPDSEGMLSAVRDLGCLQLDPISAVARSHLLVVWSRVGRYDTAVLDNLIYGDKQLFEYWAHAASIVLTEDYPVHSLQMRRYGKDMRRYGPGDDKWVEYVRAWIEKNKDLHRQILDRLTADGPLLSRQFEDNSSAGWRSSGWTNERNVNRMLDFMWMRGEIMVAGRSGLQKLWDLSERCLPEWIPREEWSAEEVVRYAAQKAIRALGVARIADIKYHYIRGRYHGLPQVLKRLESEGCIEQVRIVDEGAEWPGTWYIHAEDIPSLEKLDGDWQPRTTLLSPFDNLICDRPRTEQLFNFSFRIEIYVPKEQRKYGYYVLPILHGDRLIGRIDPTVDRKKKQLTINAVHAEPDAPMSAEVGPSIRQAIEELATFVGAGEIAFTDRVPEGWKSSLQ